MPSHKLPSALGRAIVAVLLTLTIAGSTPAVAKENVLYTFTGGSDGSNPNSPLIFDSAGNLYGTTTNGGGVGSDGTVFELTPSGNGWTETVLYSFLNNGDGAIPSGSVLLDKKGNLYGLTQQGGAGFGTAFELSPDPSGGWTEQTIHAFAGGSDGAGPVGGLISDSQGNLYGITLFGGTGPCQVYGPGCGTIFELKRSNGIWKEAVLYSFPGGRDGSSPFGGVTIDRAGNVYGTTFGGGNGGVGIVFKLSHSAGRWNGVVLHEFTGGRDGSSPYGGVTIDRAGNLYGTTSRGGGGGCSQGCGLVFELEHLPKRKWKEIVLHGFKRDNHDGFGPSDSLIFDPAANLYGTTSSGGAYGSGIVFELMQNFDGKWTESVIQEFIGADYGFAPGTLVLGKDGYLYGSAGGGAFNFGLVFQLSP